MAGHRWDSMSKPESMPISPSISIHLRIHIGHRAVVAHGMAVMGGLLIHRSITGLRLEAIRQFTRWGLQGSAERCGP